MNQKQILAITLALVASTFVSSALVQNSAPTKKDVVKTLAGSDVPQADSDDFIDLFAQRCKVSEEADHRENMELSHAEPQKFWPVYDQYAAELSKIYDVKITLLKDYTENCSGVTSDQAENYYPQTRSDRADDHAAAIEIHPRVPQSAFGQGDRAALSDRLAAGPCN